jgi:hypothetical protein
MEKSQRVVDMLEYISNNRFRWRNGDLLCNIIGEMDDLIVDMDVRRDRKWMKLDYKRPRSYFNIDEMTLYVRSGHAVAFLKRFEDVRPSRMAIEYGVDDPDVITFSWNTAEEDWYS